MSVGENFEPLRDRHFMAILESLLFQPLGKQINFTSVRICFCPWSALIAGLLGQTSRACVMQEVR